VHLKRGGGCPWRFGAPELVDEPVARDDLILPEQQRSKQRALLHPAERERTFADPRLERAKYAELDRPRRQHRLRHL
jgi:hypothetical protein